MSAIVHVAITPIKGGSPLTFPKWAAILHVEVRMVTIAVTLSNDLARRLRPLQNRLPEIIELGLHLVEAHDALGAARTTVRADISAALESTGIVTLPEPATRSRVRKTPIRANGTPASQLIIAERRTGL